MKENPRFFPGKNIAMKIPPHQYAETVRFYRDFLGFKQIKTFEPGIVFKFGEKNLWLDKVATISQAEIWLEIITDDIATAEKKLESENVVRCDEIEELPKGFQGYWVSSPASIVHLVCQEAESL